MSEFSQRFDVQIDHLEMIFCRDLFEWTPGSDASVIDEAIDRKIFFFAKFLQSFRFARKREIALEAKAFDFELGTEIGGKFLEIFDSAGHEYETTSASSEVTSDFKANA